jgi:hypothetical protein
MNSDTFTTAVTQSVRVSPVPGRLTVSSQLLFISHPFTIELFVSFCKCPRVIKRCQRTTALLPSQLSDSALKLFLHHKKLFFIVMKLLGPLRPESAKLELLRIHYAVNVEFAICMSWSRGWLRLHDVGH